MTPRELAFKIVYEILEEGKPSHISLKDNLEKQNGLEGRDRGFITRITEGTLERLITIDYLIDSVSKVKVKKQKPIMRTALRIGVYQMIYMDSVPDSAACNETVKLLKKKGLTGLSGFANGVMRTIGREKEGLLKEAETKLSISYSCPEWLCEYFLDTYGEKTAMQILAGLLRNPGIGIRVNLSKTTVVELTNMLTKAEVIVRRGNCHEYALLLSETEDLRKLPGFKEGYFQVQDESSMYVAELADIEKDDFVVDVCAAPGGKSLHAADILACKGGSGSVLSRDLTEGKIRLINENIDRNGFKNISAEIHDATVFDEKLFEKADVVFADVPCSGIGIIAKKPDIKYNMTPEKQKELVVLQRKIIDNAVRYVKKGGTFMYSTCTINRAENEENAEYIEKDLGLKKTYEKQFLPGIDGCDGFFIARFEK